MDLKIELFLDGDIVGLQRIWEVECWKTRGIHTDQDGYSTTGRYIDI